MAMAKIIEGRLHIYMDGKWVKVPISMDDAKASKSKNIEREVAKAYVK